MVHTVCPLFQLGAALHNLETTQSMSSGNTVAGMHLNSNTCSMSDETLTKSDKGRHKEHLPTLGTDIKQQISSSPLSTSRDSNGVSDFVNPTTAAPEQTSPDDVGSQDHSTSVNGDCEVVSNSSTGKTLHTGRTSDIVQNQNTVSEIPAEQEQRHSDTVETGGAVANSNGDPSLKSPSAASQSEHKDDSCSSLNVARIHYKTDTILKNAQGYLNRMQRLSVRQQSSESEDSDTAEHAATVGDVTMDYESESSSTEKMKLPEMVSYIHTF